MGTLHQSISFQTQTNYHHHHGHGNDQIGPTLVGMDREDSAPVLTAEEEECLRWINIVIVIIVIVIVIGVIVIAIIVIDIVIIIPTIKLSYLSSF